MQSIVSLSLIHQFDGYLKKTVNMLLCSVSLKVTIKSLQTIFTLIILKKEIWKPLIWRAWCSSSVIKIYRMYVVLLCIHSKTVMYIIVTLIRQSFHVARLYFRASLVKIAGRGIPTASPHGNRTAQRVVGNRRWNAKQPKGWTFCRLVGSLRRTNGSRAIRPPPSSHPTSL